MNEGMKTLIYPVRDLDAAKALFRALLGVDPTTDEAYYVGFELGDQQIGLDPNGHSRGLDGPVPYWHVDDIEKTLEALVQAGATEKQPVQVVGGSRRTAIVSDVDGGQVGLLQDG